MHTKKTNNTNKLMQISYHSALTKIQKKKKNFFLYQLLRLVLAGIAWNWPVFKPERNVDISILIFVPVRYIPTDMVSTTLIIPRELIPLFFFFFFWVLSSPFVFFFLFVFIGIFHSPFFFPFFFLSHQFWILLACSFKIF